MFVKDERHTGNDNENYITEEKEPERTTVQSVWKAVSNSSKVYENGSTENRVGI